MTNALEWIWKEVVVAYLRYYPTICLQGLSKTVKKPSVQMGGVLAEIETTYLSSTSLDYTSLFSDVPGTMKVVLFPLLPIHNSQSRSLSYSEQATTLALIRKKSSQGGCNGQGM
jgi:hypothetical protein